MTEAVLRHPDLPNQPIVVPVASDGTVALPYQSAGWEIDPNTTPDDAREERPEPVEAPAPEVRFESAERPTEAAEDVEDDAGALGQPWSGQQPSTGDSLDLSKDPGTTSDS